VSIALRCPQCGTINQVDIAAAQVAVACTGCQVQLRMPRATSPPHEELPPVLPVATAPRPERAPLGTGHNPFAEQSPPVVAKQASIVLTINRLHQYSVLKGSPADLAIAIGAGLAL
jgi:hypothetical protein